VNVTVHVTCDGEGVRKRQGHIYKPVLCQPLVWRTSWRGTQEHVKRAWSDVSRRSL